jgi:hypothetical protein
MSSENEHTQKGVETYQEANYSVSSFHSLSEHLLVGEISLIDTRTGPNGCWKFALVADVEDQVWGSRQIQSLANEGFPTLA